MQQTRRPYDYYKNFRKYLKKKEKIEQAQRRATTDRLDIQNSTRFPVHKPKNRWSYKINYHIKIEKSLRKTHTLFHLRYEVIYIVGSGAHLPLPTPLIRVGEMFHSNLHIIGN